MPKRRVSMLPEDMLLEIFYRLPVKSLVRFMCVCKTWNQLIGSPSFTKAHIANQTASTSNKYILYEDNNMCTLFTDTESLFDGTRHSKLRYSPELFVRDVTCDVCYLVIHGVCDGLLCLSHQCYDIVRNIYLWNPICRKAKILPQLGTTINHDYVSNRNAGVSFGYDGDDYKVIVIARVNKLHVVSVYSLSTNSWNTINAKICSEEECDEEASVMTTKFVDGAAYMMTSSGVVICFKLSDETIRMIKLPKELWATGITFTMEAYGETIAVFGHKGSYLSMWILCDKSFSSTSPWEKKFRIQVQEVSRHQAVGFLNNGKYLVRTFNFEGDLCVVTTLYLCDVSDCPKLTEFRSLTELRSRYGLPPKYPNFQGRIHSNYMESLLLINEASVDPFVQTETEMRSSSCSSMLFTLQWDITE